MQALILAGGKGTRLRPLTLYTPKPIVPVVNRPFLLYQIDVLRRAGVTDVILSLNYQPDKIQDILGDGSEHGVSLSFVTEPSPLGTAGAYKFAEEEIKETTLVLNGDILTDLDLSKMLEIHRANGSAATIALAPVPDPSAYGLVETGQNGEVRRFLEKPSAGELEKLSANTVNAGIYLLEPAILELIPPKENSSFEYDVFPAILEKGLDFRSYILANAYWRDIGTPASYLEAHFDYLRGEIKTSLPAPPGAADVATAAVVDTRSVLGEGCVIKPNARVQNSVLGPGVVLEEKASVENSVVWAHARISAGAEVKGAIIGRGCYIGRSARISEGAVLGDKASIPDYSRV